jgi:hypothetical protein
MLGAAAIASPRKETVRCREDHDRRDQARIARRRADTAVLSASDGVTEVARLLGISDQVLAFPDERGPARDALWYCDMTAGKPLWSLEVRLAELRARRGAADPGVRALAVNGAERTAAVRRTEAFLRRTALAS